MRLHRYFGSHAETTLDEKRLLLGTVSSFNDPFEFVHAFTGDYTVDQAERDLEPMSSAEVQKFLEMLDAEFPPSVVAAKSGLPPRRRLAEFFVETGGRPPVVPSECQRMADQFFRLCCFSLTDVDPKDEILLWSHYAKCHRGVRIEFELDENNLPLHRVKYSEKRCAIDLGRSGDPDHTNKVLQDTFQTKATVWSYEHEVRLILKKECAQVVPVPLGFRYYLPFDAACIKTVDFGIDCDAETIATILGVVRSKFPHTRIRRAHHHPDEFRITYADV